MRTLIALLISLITAIGAHAQCPTCPIIPGQPVGEVITGPDSIDLFFPAQFTCAFTTVDNQALPPPFGLVYFDSLKTFQFVNGSTGTSIITGTVTPNAPVIIDAGPSTGPRGCLRLCLNPLPFTQLPTDSAYFGASAILYTHPSNIAPLGQQEITTIKRPLRNPIFIPTSGQVISGTCTNITGNLNVNLKRAFNAGNELQLYLSYGGNEQLLDTKPAVNAGNYTLTIDWPAGVVPPSGSGTARLIVRSTNPVGENRYTLPDFNQVTVTQSQTDIECNGEGNGSITLMPTNGTAPYTFVLDGNTQITGTMATGLSGGYHSSYLVDANGCTSQSSSVEIEEPSALLVDDVQSNLNLTNLTADVLITASGGTPPYSYLWNTVPPLTTNQLNAVPMGVYTVTVTDGNGCTENHQVYVFTTVSTAEEVGNTPLISGHYSASGNSLMLFASQPIQLNHLRLAAADGRTIPLTTSILALDAQHYLQLPELCPGIYILQAHTHTNHAVHLRFSVMAK